MKIDKFGDELRGKINKYLSKTHNKYEVYFRVMFYCFVQMLRIPKHLNDNVVEHDENVLRIAIRLDGGLGDVLVYGLWVKEFSKIIESPFVIDIFPHRSSMISKAAFKGDTYISRIYNYSDFEDNIKKYDLAIGFRRFPHIVYYNMSKIKKFSPNLIKLIHILDDFQRENNKFFINGANLDTQIDLYSICRNEKRIQQPDVGSYLGITENTKLYLPLEPDSFDILKENNIEDEVYITLTRSVDQSYSQKKNVRLWPLEYYEELIQKIKQRYPQIKFVQLGVARCDEIRGIDVNLLGKTNLEQVKAILKNSILHIDGECGMVHTKHFLYGKSAVFFGQTAIEYLGYSNNINLKSDGCSHWCEWIVNDWQTHCIRGYEEPPCMTELKPDYVFDNIVSYLDNVFSTPQNNVRILEIENFDNYLIQNPINNKKVTFYGMEFYEYAKRIAENNKVCVYDSKLDNKNIKEASDLGFLLEYADIYNIPEIDSGNDIVVINSSHVVDKYVSKELERISNSRIILIK